MINSYDPDISGEDCSARERRDFRITFANSCVGLRTLPRTRWDSPAESELASDLAKYLRMDVEIKKGQNLDTSLGVFRLDLVLCSDGRLVGIEVDGRDYHKNKVRDFLRDCAILDAGHVHVIYRFDASATLYHASDCLHLLSRYEPSSFDRKSKEVLLLQLASRDVKGIEELGLEGVEVHYGVIDSEIDQEDESRHIRTLRISRREPRAEMVSRTIDWIRRVKKKYPAVHLDEPLIRQFRINSDWDFRNN